MIFRALEAIETTLQETSFGARPCQRFLVGERRRSCRVRTGAWSGGGGGGGGGVLRLRA